MKNSKQVFSGLILFALAIIGRERAGSAAA
jgi:hypothetical protein